MDDRGGSRLFRSAAPYPKEGPTVSVENLGPWVDLIYGYGDAGAKEASSLELGRTSLDAHTSLLISGTVHPGSGFAWRGERTGSALLPGNHKVQALERKVK